MSLNQRKLTIGKTTGSNFGTKVRDFVGKVAGVVGRYAPGIAGTIGKGIASIFNHPEWWKSHPGDPVTTNSPLAPVKATAAAYPGAGDTVGVVYPRAMFAEFRSRQFSTEQVGGITLVKSSAFHLTEAQVNQFLIPHVRAVVNAIPLQAVDVYQSCMEANAHLYAIWQTLKKWAYLAKHTPPYMHTFDDVAFPLLQSANAEKLQALIKRIYEALSANVRIPHVLCEYLAWRFGRIYKSTDSEKAGYIMYNAIPIGLSIAEVESQVAALIQYSSTSTQAQQANADLFNVYASHDQEVHISDATQARYDKKEWMLRLNLNVDFDQGEESSTLPADAYGWDKAVLLDSSLDNQTVFMSSVVSTIVPEAPSGSSTEPIFNTLCLFPVSSAYVYYAIEKPANVGAANAAQGFQLFQSLTPASGSGDGRVNPIGNTNVKHAVANSAFYLVEIGGQFSGITLQGKPVPNTGFGNGSQEPYDTVPNILVQLMACKSLDIYNMGVYIGYSDRFNVKPAAGIAELYNCDVTAISLDMGLVPADTIAIEQNYAAANLLDVHYTREKSTQSLERTVLQDTVHFVNEVTPTDVTVAADVHPSL